MPAALRYGRPRRPPSPRTTRSISGLAALLGVLALAVGCGAERAPAPAEGEETHAAARRRLERKFERGQPWERVRAKVIRARRIVAVTVDASVRVVCPRIARVQAAPLPKDTGNRFFGALDLLAVDTVWAHHVEAAVIEAEEIVAVKVRAPRTVSTR